MNPSLISKIRNNQNIVNEREGGTMAYRNECPIMKIPGDDGNPLNVNIVDPITQQDPAPAENDFDSNTWLSGDAQIPTRERSSGPDGQPTMMIPPGVSYNHRLNSNGGYVESQSSGTNDMSVSPHPDSLSNRPTPNSSSTSEQRNSTSDPRSTSGRTSFDASPIGSHQPLSTQAEMDAARVAFFQDPNNFGMGGSGSGITPGREFVMPDTPGNSFAVPSGWEMPGTGTGMTPVAEGVLRHLMNMPPMDAMDLGWDSGA